MITILVKEKPYFAIRQISNNDNGILEDLEKKGYDVWIIPGKDIAKEKEKLEKKDWKFDSCGSFIL